MTESWPGPPAEEKIAPGMRVPPGPCDATASGSEDAQVWLAKGRFVLALCAHHASLYGRALIAAGWQVTRDYRGRW